MSLLRVTNGMMAKQSVDSMNRHRAESARLQQNIASGRRLTSLGEDPIATRNVLREESNLRQIDSHRRSANEADLLLSESDNALAAVRDVTDRVNELTIQMANDTYSAADRAAAANEVRQLRSRLVEIGNTQSNGRYVFGGLGNAGAPFDAAGTFTGDNNIIELPVGKGGTIEAGVPGGTPFEDPAGGPGLFDTLDSLETALAGNSGPGISALIDEVRGHTDRVAEARQQVGYRFERLETVKAAFDRVELAAADALSRDRDTDIPSAVLGLKQSELGLQAALQVTSRLADLNLMSFL